MASTQENQDSGRERPLTTIDEPFPFNLGDIVLFRAASSEYGLMKLKIKNNTESVVYNLGDNKKVPPAMIVTEIVMEDIKKAHFYDEKTGKQTKSRFKVNCQWFSYKTNKFASRWFNSGVLEKISTTNQFINGESNSQRSNFKINEVVVLRTIEYRIVQSELTIETDKQTESEVYLTFPSPKMVVVGFEESKERKPLYDKVTGKRKRYASENLVKCMWYDYLLGKYSEHLFIPEALMKLKAKSE